MEWKPSVAMAPECKTENADLLGQDLEGLSRQELMAELLRARKELEHMHRSESKHQHDREKFHEITFALKERVKELKCLYLISEIVAAHGIDLDLILKRTVEIIPEAWQYPDITCCRISLCDRLVQSPGFKITPWSQAQNIVANGKCFGSLEVLYLEERPPREEGPFLAEERSLINVIAERLGKLVERELAERALIESEAKNVALLNAVPDLMFQIDRQGTFVGFHEGTFLTLREIGKNLIGRNIYYLAQEDLIPRRLLDQGMTYVKQTLATGNPQIFEQHVTSKGKARDYEVRMVVCSNDEVLGIVRDITRRKRLEREILEISNREQRRIGQDLHDSLCQHLAGIGFMSKVLEKRISGQEPVEPAEVLEIVELIDQAITLTRGFARGLNPVELMTGGLMVSLEELAANVQKIFGVTCAFICDTPACIIDNEMATHLYRIVQEALNNAIKHGKASTIVIVFEKKGSACTLIVSDNGIGIGKTSNHGKGMGLSIMRYRASMFGATLDIRGRESGGTDLVCSFQLRDGN